MPQNSSELAIFERLREHLGFYKYADVEHQSVTALAKYCRVSRRTIYNWLNSKTKPKQAKLKLIKEWIDSRI
ncbi:MAG: helix-turn-helix domain-containing protein [Candidatus Omnitrophota bacterium]|nr:MAG: helix-turn-helix domain-containing protein [Candidatus Omnitrophota bacterium]